MTETILCVDDQADVRDVLRKMLQSKFDVEVASSGQEALDRMDNGASVAVLVSDLHMPDMDGIQLLTNVKKRHPDTMRILLTGAGDLDSAIHAVNDGHVFRFLTKPCSMIVLHGAVTAALEQRRLILAERQLLDETLRGIINTLSEVLALANPVAFGRAIRIRQWVRAIATLEGRATEWSLDAAAALSQVGCISVPERILVAAETDGPLTAEERAILDKHPAVGADLLRRIPRLEVVAEMVARQRAPVDATKQSSPAEAGGQLLRVASDFDHLLQSGKSRERALTEMRKHEAKYDLHLLVLLESAVRGKHVLERLKLSIPAIAVGMVLAEDVVSSNGTMMLREGFEISEVARLRLQLSAASGMIPKELAVFVPRERVMGTH